MEAEDSELDVDLIVARELINRGYNLEIHSPIQKGRGIPSVSIHGARKSDRDIFWKIADIATIAKRATAETITIASFDYIENLNELVGKIVDKSLSKSTKKAG